MTVLPFGRRWDGDDLARLADVTTDMVKAAIANLLFEHRSPEGIAAGGLIYRLVHELSKQELELVTTLIVGMLASEMTNRAIARDIPPFEVVGNLRAALYHSLLELLDVKP
jgi:hypothetical protein